MSQQEDFYKPTNIRDTLFGDIQLPQKSKIQKPPSKIDVYQQEDQQEDDDNDLGFSKLGQISKVQPKSKYQSPLSVISETSEPNKESSCIKTRANSSQNQTNSQKQTLRKSQQPLRRTAQQVRKLTSSVKYKKQSKKPIQTKKEVDLDAQIGEVRQWGQKDENQQSQQSDFDKSQQQVQKIDKQFNQDARKRIQEKLKSGSFKTQQNKPLGGLRTKFEQIKKQNSQQTVQNKNITPNSIKQNQSKKTQNHLSNIQENQTSSDNLNFKQRKTNQNLSTNNSVQSKSAKGAQSQSQLLNIKQSIQQNNKNTENQQQDDDPWQKVNEKTKQKYQNKKQGNKILQSMTKQQVIDFYTKKFIFAQDDIKIEFQNDQFDDQQNVVGCWQALFGCFKQDKNKDSEDKQNKKSHKNSNDRMAMRLVAISKISLSNTDQEFFVLKHIWETLTNKKFSRYGNHWNQIGFQGRDPATDLRSTGFLSLFQWFLFIDQNSKQSKQIYQWSSETDFPLALTHIKATGLFLKLIKNGKIKGKGWNEFQKNYNSIVWNVFKKIKKSYNQSQNVGQLVDSNLQSVRKNFKECLKQYDQHKKT